MNAEAKIVSRHNLDCTSLENLATDIACRLGRNIEYGKYQKENGEDNFVVMGTVRINNNGIITTLYDLRYDENSTCNFVLKLGEEVKAIYTNFIDFVPPWNEHYNTLERAFYKDCFPTNPFHLGIFKELQKLGADKLYFIKDTFVPTLAISVNTTMEAYLKIIQKETTFFAVPLPCN